MRAMSKILGAAVAAILVVAVLMAGQTRIALLVAACFALGVVLPRTCTLSEPTAEVEEEGGISDTPPQVSRAGSLDYEVIDQSPGGQECEAVRSMSVEVSSGGESTTLATATTPSWAEGFDPTYCGAIVGFKDPSSCLWSHVALLTARPRLDGDEMLLRCLECSSHCRVNPFSSTKRVTEAGILVGEAKESKKEKVADGTESVTLYLPPMGLRQCIHEGFLQAVHDVERTERHWSLVPLILRSVLQFKRTRKILCTGIPIVVWKRMAERANLDNPIPLDACGTLPCELLQAVEQQGFAPVPAEDLFRSLKAEE